MTDMNTRELPVLSVSQITGLIKETLEGLVEWEILEEEREE